MFVEQRENPLGFTIYPNKLPAKKDDPVAFTMSRVISKLRRVAYMVGSHVSLSSHQIFASPVHVQPER
jgi:hypothetical protein